MEGEMKRKFVKEYGRRLRLVLKSKLNGRNKIMAMNTWAVALLRYGAGILKWTKDEIAAMDCKTRKLIGMVLSTQEVTFIDYIYRRKTVEEV
jgi:hypothetical protein